MIDPFRDTHITTHFAADTITYEEFTILLFLNTKPQKKTMLFIYIVYTINLYKLRILFKLTYYKIYYMNLSLKDGGIFSINCQKPRLLLIIGNRRKSKAFKGF
jgi:hypothetical protein